MSGPVDNAVSAISEHLEQDCLIHDVTHDELSSINRILKGMTPAERTEAISKLSDREIETWTSELDNEGFLGIDEGLSADERRDLHDMLASLLDAKQLSRVYNAYEYREQKMELASAISTNSLASTKLAFVKELAPQTIDGSAGKQKDSGPYSSDLGDTDARAVAEVLGA
jgi:hypothetical protein